MAKKKKPDPDITYRGTSITLPADPSKMAVDDAIEVLQRKSEDEKIKMDVHERIEHHPHDALVAFYWAMKDTYGWASPQTIKTFFGDVAPDMVKVPTGPKADDFVQVPCGQFKLPNVSEPIMLHLDFGNCMFHITGKVRKGDQQYIVDLANKAREYLKTNSIFRGKAIRLPCDSDGDANFSEVSFIETDYIKPEELVLNPDELAQVEASLWTPIKQTEACIQHGIPLNRGVLLEGTYGTGKSMTANVTSRVCTDNDWTFILLDDVRGLKETLLFAQKYEPCVIFAEDIDRATQERNEEGNMILNTIDGILTKNSRVITVLTTNFVEKIDQAMLRPGRLDAVISVRPPEPEAVKRLMRLYGRELIAADDTLDKSAEQLSGQIPATIREVVERSKLGMIGRGADTVNDDDLYASAVGMTRHLQLLATEKAEHSPEEKMGRAFRALMQSSLGVEDAVDEMGSHVRKVTRSNQQTQRSMASLQEAISESGSEVSDKLDSVKTDTQALRRGRG